MDIEKNKMEIKFRALSVNESFARVVVSAFALQLNPSVDELNDIKTAISEAVTNCVVHAYPREKGDVYLACEILDNELFVEIRDFGVGIADIEKAKEPFFTTRPEEERSGMGFTVMESFMDEVDVSLNAGGGLCVKMRKKIGEEVCKAVGGD